MKIKTFITAITLLVIVFSSFKTIAQATETDSDDDNDSQLMEKKGFHFGFFVGPYWANKYTANIYNGYGLDVNGNFNEFATSLMNYKINYEYAGYDPTTGVSTGQPDRIALALGVNAQNSGNTPTWHFNESDMPQNMHYTINFLVGLNARYSVDKKSAIILNLNASKLKLNGNFTIETDVNPNQNQLNNGVNTFSIFGGEQRLMFQFGFNRIIGDNKRLNFFLEGGLNATLAKFDNNYIMINNLKIDLTTAYVAPNSGGYPSQIYFPKHIGIGFGAFASAGFYITISPKWTVLLIYSPTYDKINIGPAPSYKMQHAAGIRCYYNF